MRRTLFYIPHEIGPLPIFGWGWALILWGLIAVVSIALAMRRDGWQKELQGQVAVWLLVAAAIVFLLPRIEQPITDGVLTIPPIAADSGLPIRGYGVLLLLAVVSGVGVTTWRASRAGIHPDVILSLAFAMVVSGIVGARVFFVIQYWSELQGATLRDTLANIFSVDKGGLVVYGSLIGAMIGFAYFCRRHRVAPLPLADLIAPGMALGLAIGRIGCLMNGCCFGGPCDLPWAITFPAGSPPYEDQKGDGVLLGLQFTESEEGLLVASREAGGPLDRAGMKPGDRIVAINGHPVDQPRQFKNHILSRKQQAHQILEDSGPEITWVLSDGRTLRVDTRPVPARSLPVHPTQIYSAINGVLLCLLAWLAYPFRWKHGQVFALTISLYAVSRFLLELIRTDEGAFLGQLTISQNVSLVVGMGMITLWVYIMRREPMPSPV